MALLESIIVNYTGFISFVYSLISTIGIVIVAFVLYFKTYSPINVLGLPLEKIILNICP